MDTTTFPNLNTPPEQSTANPLEYTSFYLNKIQTFDTSPLSPLPMITLFQGTISYLIDIALIIPTNMIPPGNDNCLTCTASADNTPILTIIIDTKANNLPVGSYSLFYNRYQWTQSAIDTLEVKLSSDSGLSTTTHILGISDEHPGDIPEFVSILNTVRGIDTLPMNTLAPCIAFKENRVNIVLVLPELDTGIQAPKIAAYPIYSKNGNNVLPILIKDAVFSDSSSTYTIFVLNYVASEANTPFKAVHACIKFTDDDPFAIPPPGPRGTYVAPLKPEC